MDKNIIISTILTLAAIALVLFIIFNPFGAKPVPTPTPVPAENSTSLGEEISDQVNNPAKSLPNNNVFEQAKVNPYKDVYKNPFE